MPPSGYTSKEAHFVGEFLRSNLARLKEESLPKKLSPEDALKQELENIKTIGTRASYTQKTIMELSSVMYNFLNSTSPKDWDDFMLNGEKVISQIAVEALLVKLPEADEDI